MRLLHLLTALTLTLPTLAALNTIHNNCTFPVYFTSVSTNASPTVPIPPSTSLSEPQYFNGTGTALKLTLHKNDLYTADAPVLHFSYTYHPGTDIYYDLSTHNGFAFWGRTVELLGDETGAEGVVWNGKPGPNHTLRFVGETALELTLCA